MLDHDVRTATKNAKTPPILRLPSSVRQRIYLHVGLIPTDGSATHCVLDLHGHNQSLDLGFHGLLVSCRTIYTEASVILYSANRFNIRYWDKRSLEPLRNMTPRTLSSLTYLKIILNETACHERDECEAYDAYRATLAHKDIAAQGEGEYFLAGHNPPLRGHQALAGTLLTEWASTVAHLSLGIAAKQLELCVVCDVDEKDINTAKRVVEPLSRLPLLKDCHLRLSGKSTPELNGIARHAALQLRGLCWPREMAASQPDQESSKQSCHGAYTGSRLLDLPRELRFRILEHTDLITPWKEVTWSRKHHAFLGVKAFCAPLDYRGEECPPHVHHGCQFVDCWQTWPEPCIGCFCRVNHSAFSSTCMCWAPPRDLFLVCRALYEDALVVFYSGNRFVVHDSDHKKPYTAPLARDSPPRMAASIFFTDVVPEHCLKELRFVELVFPPYSHGDWPRDAAIDDWEHTMSLARQRLNLPGLTLRIIMAGLYGVYENPDNRLYMSQKRGERIIAGYTRIVAPVACLGSAGLARFYSSFAWPWAYTRESRAAWLKHGWEWVTAHEKVLEERYGRLVMGDRYDSAQSGGGEPTDSSWVRKYIRDF